ncbi:MAG: alpha/beta hydrolase-fold protein [Planctomycetota bacterium]
MRIWLPRGYHKEPTRRLPVLYLLDGQNVFGDSTAFAGVGWHTDETAQRLIDRGRIEPLLLVGVDNSGSQRTEDYTPVAWQDRGGHASEFGSLLIDSIKPFVDAHYRTEPGREHTAIAGASLGGLLSLHLGLTHPDVFGGVAALSPTLWWARHFMLHELAALHERVPVRIWLDFGKQEAATGWLATQAFAELLVEKGWREHRNARRADLRYREIARGRHDEASWGRRFARVLTFLFPPPAKVRRRRVRTKQPRALGAQRLLSGP